MDPFTAIGLAGNILGFLDFGCKIVSKSKSILASASGASAHNEDLDFMTQQFQSIAASLQVSKPIGSMTKEELSLHKLAIECNSISVDLMKLLDELKAKKPKSKRESLRAAIRDWKKQEQKDELELKLDRCRQQLNLQVMALTRSESLERLNKLVSYGQASEDELQSLIRNVESLRLGSNVSFISPEALNQIQSLLRLTDDAIFSVRRNRFLDGLRFEQIHERFEDVEEAHDKTFDWIFEARRLYLVGEEMGSYNHVDSRNNIDDDDEGSERSSGEDDEEDEEISMHASQSSRKGSEVNSADLGGDSSSFASQESRPAENRLPSDERSDGNSINDFIPDLKVDSDDGSSFNWDQGDAPLVDDRISVMSEGEISNRGPPQILPSRLYSPSRALEISQPLWEAMTEARDHFIAWLEEGDGIFHISGKPGSGKSTLMKFICEHSKTEDHLQVWAGDKKLVLGKFFFWKPGSTLQKSLKGLIRGLLHCLLSKSPHLIPLAFPVQWEASMYREKIYIENQDCQQGFETLISHKAVYTENKFVFFIDGLDEFEGNHIALIRRLFEWAKNTQSVKVCVSSREWTVFQEGFQNCPKFRLHELTHSDIQQFVRDRFQEMDLGSLSNDWDSDSRNDIVLQNEVILKSDGVFLWVSLILRHIEDGLVNGDQMEDLMKVINSLPTELEPMLQQLLSSIAPANRKLAYSILSLAFFCSRHNDSCRLMQYSFMEEYIRDKNFAIDSPVRLFTAAENTQRLERAKKRIYGVCKGFLELRPLFTGNRPRVIEIFHLLGDVVRFTHRSIVEYLESQHFKQKMAMELPDFEHLDAYYQTYLFQIKHVHLPRFYFAPSIRSQDRRHTPYQYDSLFRNLKANKYIPLLWSRFHCAPYPSFNSDLASIIVLYLHLSLPGYSTRFYRFLDAIRRAVPELNLDIADAYVRVCDDVISCDPSDLITLLSAGLGWSEYILHRRDISSTLMSKCIDLCLNSIGHCHPKYLNRSSPIDVSMAMKRPFQALEALFGQGGSPDSGPSSSKATAFHILLGRWCFSKPSLAVIAFMLYHGANPRFAIVLGEKQYKIRIAVKEDGVLGPVRLRTVFKAYFKTERPAPESEYGLEATRIVLRRRLLIPQNPPMLGDPTVSSTPLRADNDAGHFPRLVIIASPRTLDVLAKHGRTLELRSLVSIWFPDQGSVLQQVIDWILELGVLLNADHRSHLKLKFGHLLRPFFDDDNPDFIGWDPVLTAWPEMDLMSFISGEQLYDWG